MSALKFTISLWLTVSSLFLLSSPILAANSDPEYIKENWNALTQSSYTTDNLMCDILAKLAGSCPFGPVAVRKMEGGQIKLTLENGQPGGGAIGTVTNAMATLYTPPTSTVYYLANVGQGFGMVKAAYAQVPGSGQGIIQPILSLWQVIRNFTYLLFIVIFLAVGFMIMLRQKINPQTVITVQAALPGLIIGLILVTFSYFISALIIDLAFVGMQLVAQIFIQFLATTPNEILKDANSIRNMANDSNVFNLFYSSFRIGDNFQDVSSGVANTLAPISVNGISLSMILTAIVGAVVGWIIGGPISILTALAGGGIGVALASTVNPLPGIIGLIVPMILIIALMIQFFRLFFQLIGAYISILVSTLTSPLIILFGSLPGKGGVFSFWWKTLLGNALIFPAVFATFLFAGMILGTTPADWQVTPPLFGGLNAELLRFIIAYGILLGTPAVPGMVKQALGVKDLQGIPQAAMGGFMGGTGVIRAGYGRATGPLHAAQEEQRKRDATNMANVWAPGAAAGGLRAALTRLARNLPT